MRAELLGHKMYIPPARGHDSEARKNVFSPFHQGLWISFFFVLPFAVGKV